MSSSAQLSKFQAVRSFFEGNPDAAAQDAVDAAAKLGLDVTVQYARQIRSKTKGAPAGKGTATRKKKKRRRKPAAKKLVKKESRTATSQSAPKASRQSGQGTRNLDPALEAVRFIKRLGGIAGARAALASGEAIYKELQPENAGE